MKSLLLPSAESDLRWFLRYYSVVFPQGRANAVKRYRDARRVIETHPNAGQLQIDRRTRVFPIPRTPFSLRYAIHSNYIGISSIHDQRSDPARLFDDDLQ